ncbi:hypothetical protein PENSPDRAFT_688711 [Peniophora sp. CONT]|nr:hypothetical protein PENSPDRAFT_688711 [Peniophora sp. CONT]
MSSVADLWKRALEEYHRSVGVDLRDQNEFVIRNLGSCLTADAILDALADISQRVDQFREGKGVSRQLKRLLQPMVHGLSMILNATAETASSGIPGGKGVFAAIAVLLEAANRVSTVFDDLEELLESFVAYIERLRVRVRAPFSQDAGIVAVKALVQMLKAFALATNMMRQGRTRLYLMALFTKTDDVQMNIRKIHGLLSAEERLATAELIAGMHELATDVHTVKDQMLQLLYAFDDMRPKVEHVSTRTEDILQNVSGMRALLESHLDRTERLTQSRAVPAEASGIQLTLNVPNVNWNGLCSQLRRVMSRLSPRDRDLVDRAFATLLVWAIDSESEKERNDVSTRRASIMVNDPAHDVSTFLSLACIFLLLLMLSKLNAIARPLGSAGGVVTIIDVFGMSFTLSSDVFSSWDRTHTFIVDVFKTRPQGLRYIEKGDYVLQDSESTLVDKEDWAQTVKANTLLNMSIILREPLLRCPYCQAVSFGMEEPLGDGRVIWLAQLNGSSFILIHDIMADFLVL